MQSQLVSAVGFPVRKHGRRGLPHSRVLRYDQTRTLLAWAEDASGLTKALSVAADSTSSRTRGGVVDLRFTTLRPIAVTRLSLTGGRADGAPELTVEASREEMDTLHVSSPYGLSLHPSPKNMRLQLHRLIRGEPRCAARMTVSVSVSAEAEAEANLLLYSTLILTEYPCSLVLSQVAYMYGSSQHVKVTCSAG